MNKKQSIGKDGIGGIIGIGIVMLAGLLSLSFVYALPLESAWSDAVGIDFNTDGAWECVTTGTGAVVWEKPGEISINAMTNCLNPFGVGEDGSQTACCPQGYSCSLGVIGAGIQGYVCTQSGIPDAQSCDNFKTKDDCISISASYPKLPAGIQDTIEEGNLGKIIEDIQDNVDAGFSADEINFCDSTFMHTKGNKCAYLGNCKCVWNDNAKECRGMYQLTFQCPGSDDDNNIQNNIITCENIPKPVRDTCDQEDGQIIHSWSVVRKNASGAVMTPSEGEGCHAGEKVYPCPPNIKTESSTLPFFGMFNLIAAGIMIAIGYFMINNRRRK